MGLDVGPPQNAGWEMRFLRGVMLNPHQHEWLDEAEVLQVLDKEIAWCQEHPDAIISEDYQAGFRKGVEQAKYLIHKLTETSRYRQAAELEGRTISGG